MSERVLASWEVDDPETIILPDLPDDYVGAWLEPQELRKRNQELMALGRRICRTHQGAALPLNDQNFYYAKRSTGRFDTECKKCAHKRTVRSRKYRYLVDEAYRLSESERKSDWYRRKRIARIKEILGVAA
jgi:hypothetical protein